jgi:hypothetical protein
LSTANNVIDYYDAAKPTALHTDASRLKGLGFVLRQQHADGSWRTIQAGSRFLSDAESRYAMIELELLAICWATQKCRLFLEGLPLFEIITDHRPLVPILNDYCLDQIDNPRLQRLRIKLDRFNYHSTWVQGKLNLAADALSRAPLHQATAEDQVAEQDDHRYTAINALYTTGIDARLQEVLDTASNDQEYQELKNVITNGFPNEKSNLPLHLRPYWNMRGKLAVDQDFIVCGKRTVIPKLLRKSILDRLKSGHMGATKTKERARQVVWWPLIDNDIELVTKQCATCQEGLARQGREPMISRPLATRAFQELHLDFGEYANIYYLIAVDGYSGYPCVVNCGKRAPTSVLISGLRQIFIQTAIPDRIWTDGGPQFTAHACTSFLDRWGVNHSVSSPEYAQSNGRAEAAVKMVKKMLRGATRQGNMIDQDAFLEALLMFKNTPLYDGRIPSVLVFGTPVKDTLPAHRRNFCKEWQETADQMETSAAAMLEKVRERYNAQSRSLRRLINGQSVAIYNNQDKSWNRHGIILECMSNREYLVKVQSGRVLRRNRRLLRPREAIPPRFAEHVEAPCSAQSVKTSSPVLPDNQPGTSDRVLRDRSQLRKPQRLIEED